MNANQRTEKLKVFISYSRHDVLLARSINDTIEDAGFDVWIDSDIQVGQNWVQAISDQLERSDVLILLISAESMTSEYVRDEYRAFLDLRKPIMPILVRRFDQSMIPPELQSILWIDASDGLHIDHIDRLLDSLYKHAETIGKQPIRPPSPRQKRTEAPPLGTLKLTTVPPPTEAPPSAPVPEVGDTVEPDKPRRVFTDTGVSVLSDKPIQEGAKDLLQFKDYASAIAEFVMHPNTAKPLTISINAEWGGGKTSLMYMVKNELRDDLPKVWFNAWQYSGEEALWAALALSVIKQTITDQPLWKRLRLQWHLTQFDSRRLLRDILVGFLIAGVVTLFGILAIVIVTAFQDRSFEPEWNQVLSVFLLGGGVGLYRVGKRMLEEIRGFFNLKIDQYVSKQPDYETRIGFLLEFQANFSKVIDLITNNKQNPLIVFIDDLDRCPVPKVAELIEAMSIFLNSEGCVFILGMDMKAVAASIEIRHGKLRSYLAGEAQENDPALGRFFLEKIVQISFPIPRANHEDMMFFVQKHLGQVVERKPQLADKEAENIHGQLKDELAQIQSAAEIYDFCFNKIADIVNPDQNDTEAEDAAADLSEAERAQKQQQEGYKITSLTQKVFATEILKRFNELIEVMDVLETMLPYMDYNPRRVKRFINVFRLQAFIAIKRGKLIDIRHLNALAIWLEIALRWPDFVVAMIDDPGLDDELYFVSSTIEQLGNAPEEEKNREGFQTRWQTAEKLIQEKTIIEQHQHEKDLIKLLPQTTAFVDDADIIGILQLANQIASSAKLKQMKAQARL